MSKLAALATALVLAAALTGCAVAAPPAPTPSSTATPSPAPTPTPTVTSVMTPLDLSVTEKKWHDVISVTGIVRNFQLNNGVTNNDEIILVQVAVKTGGNYWAGWDVSRVLLIDGAGNEFFPKSLGTITAAMTAAGYTPFAVANGSTSIPASHTSAPGWIAFDVYNVIPPLSFADRVVPVEGGAATTYTVELPPVP